MGPHTTAGEGNAVGDDEGAGVFGGEGTVDEQAVSMSGRSRQKKATTVRR